MKRLIAASLLMAAAKAGAHDRPPHWAQPLPQQALPNLHQVSPTIYRSAQPLGGAQEAIDALGIKSVVSLRWTKDDPGILPKTKRIHAPIESWDVDHDEIMRALRALVDPQNQPVLLHCRHGADRTGTVVAAYRMIVENWSADDAIREMREGGYNYHAVWVNMLRYLRKLDVTAARNELGLDAAAIAATPSAAPTSAAIVTPVIDTTAGAAADAPSATDDDVVGEPAIESQAEDDDATRSDPPV